MDWPIGWKDVKDATESSFELLNLGDYGIDLVSIMDNGGGSAEVPGTQIFKDVTDILDRGKMVAFIEPSAYDLMLVPSVIRKVVSDYSIGFIGMSVTGSMFVDDILKITNALVVLSRTSDGTTAVNLRILAL